MDRNMIDVFKNRISESGITKKHLSKITGIEYQHLSRILSNRIKMTASEMLVIAHALDISCDEINRAYGT